MKKILVSVDLSDLAAQAINQAITLAAAFKSRILVLHVEVPTPSYIGNELGPPVVPIESDDDFERVQRDLQGMVNHIRQKGIEADYELAKGPVIETIIEKSKDLDVDLIILGAHNHGFLYRAFIGSICSGVIKHSHIPVMVVPGK